MLQHCEGTRVIADDIVVYGKSDREHRERLEKVLQTLSARNLTLNEKKCQFGLDRVVFMGHVLSKDGISPTKAKVIAVEQAKRPENPAEVRSFLGLVGYCSRYIQDLATVEEPLRKLTRSGVPWDWGTGQEQSFQELKRRLVSSHTMAYFNAEASETQVICDASPVGLVCILAQKQLDGYFKPVLYASRALSSVERRYSQTEKEALAIVWACERLHVYLFGIPFVIITDHKPLEVIYASPKHKPVSARIERWVLRLQSYNFRVKYRPGKYNAADALSRLPVPVKAGKEEHGEIENYMYHVTLASAPVAITAKEIEVVSGSDPEMSNLRKAIRTGDWSHPEVIKYKHVRGELTCVGKLILRGQKIVIPTQLRDQVLRLAHEGHQGIVKCKQRLREKVWWPGVDKDMEKHVKLCEACQIVNVQSTPEPLKPTVLPDKPWQKVSVDICGPFPGGEYILVAIDYYSRWFELGILYSITSSKVIGLLENWFTSHGLPEVLVSDNGVQFTSSEFSQFMSNNGIHHRKVTPYSPQANGEVERQNRTILQAIRAFVQEGKSWKKELNTFLFAYRTTPHSVTGISPAELMYGSKLRTKLPDMSHSNSNVVEGEIRDRDCLRKDKGKDYFDQRKHVKESDLQIGDTVILRQSKENKLSTAYDAEPYRVVHKYGNSVQVENIDGVQRRRNVVHMKAMKFQSEADKQNYWIKHAKGSNDWIDSNVTDPVTVDSEEITSPVVASPPKVTPVKSPKVVEQKSVVNDNLVVNRPKRTTSKPVYLKDYHTY